MSLLYIPKKFGGHSVGCLAWSSCLRRVEPVDSRIVGSVRYVEIVDAATRKWLGLVPSDDLVSVGDGNLSKKKKHFVLSRLCMLKDQEERRLESADMAATKSPRWEDNPDKNPRPVQETIVPTSFKSSQKFRQESGGNSEAMALQKFNREYATGNIGKRQVKDNAKKARVIGDDVADEHFRIAFKELSERLGLIWGSAYGLLVYYIGFDIDGHYIRLKDKDLDISLS